MPSLVCVQATHGPFVPAAIAGEEALPSLPPRATPAGPAIGLHQPWATPSLGRNKLTGPGTGLGEDSESPVTSEFRNTVFVAGPSITSEATLLTSVSLPDTPFNMSLPSPLLMITLAPAPPSAWLPPPRSSMRSLPAPP